MTSINNYESVELPIEPVKEKRNIFEIFKNFKNKKMSFSVKKKHIAVTSMVLMLSAAVYVNYLYAAGNMEDLLETGKNYGDSILVEGTANEEITDSSAYSPEIYTMQSSNPFAFIMFSILFSSSILKAISSAFSARTETSSESSFAIP